MGYLKVEYLADGARVFNCRKQSTVVDHFGLYWKCAKMGSSLNFFLLKALEGVIHQCWKWTLTELVFVETSMQTYSLSEEGFGYNYWWLKSSASHVSRENTLLRCGKIQKCRRHLQQRFVDGRTDGAYLGSWRCVGHVHSIVYNLALFTTPQRWRMEPVTCLAKSRNRPKMVPCLLTLTDR